MGRYGYLKVLTCLRANVRKVVAGNSKSFDVAQRDEERLGVGHHAVGQHGVSAEEGSVREAHNLVERGEAVVDEARLRRSGKAVARGEPSSQLLAVDRADQGDQLNDRNCD